MANLFATPTVIAKLGIIALLNNWVFAPLVHRDYEKEFKKVGDTVSIKKPNTFTVVEFDGDLSGEWQNVTEQTTDVTLDTILTVPVQITAKELSLDVKDLYTQVIEPAVQALADGVDLRIAQLYKDIPYYEDCETTTAISDILNARKKMSDNKVPFGDKRNAVMSPLTMASLLAIDAFRDLDKRGDTQALRDASLGRIFGFNFWENQNIQTHAIGSTDTAGAVDLTAGYAAGVTTIHIDALASADTIAKGTILTIAGNTGQYVITADVLLSGNEGDFPIYPALNAAVLDGAVTTFHAAATTSKENLCFHKNTFAFVTAPIEPPLGGAKGVNVTYEGLQLNVVYDYDIDQFKNKMTISLLCGFKTLTPELAVRLYDAS